MALDCNTYESIKACASCKPGFGLKVMGDVKSCVLVNQPNCLMFNTEFPWGCIVCADSYFPNLMGQCEEVVDKIPDCIIYANRYQCKRCS